MRYLIIFTIIILAVITAYFWVRYTLAPKNIQPEEALPTTPILPGPVPSLPPSAGEEAPSGEGEIITEEGTVIRIEPTLMYENPVSDFILADNGIYLFDLKSKKVILFVDKDTKNDLFESDKPLFIRSSGKKLLYTKEGDYHLYDVEAKTDTLLTNSRSVDFLTGSQTLAVHYVDNSKGINELRAVNVGKNTSRTLLATHFQEIKLTGLDTGKFLAAERPSSAVQSALYLVSFDPKSVKSPATIEPIFPESFAVDAIASPDGKFIFVSYLNSSRQLSNALIDKTGKLLLRPEFQTLAQKCSFSTDASLLVCAQFVHPLDADSFEGYIRGEFAASTRFSVVDLKSLKSFNFGSQSFNFDAEKVAVSLTEGNLYFLNRNNKKLYSFVLPTDILTEQRTVTTTTP